MQIQEITAQSILTKSKLPASDYCINPYLGCAHACVYCYARFLGRWRGHKEDWGEYVDVKVNAPELLKKELTKKRRKGLVLIGSMTDAYQPLERKYKLTRRMLSLLSKSDYPISILTKSDLVVRDIDILKKSKEYEVGITINFLGDNIRKRFEPRSASIQKRLKALKTLHDAGVKTYAFIGPIFPRFTDYYRILETVSPHVDFVMAESLNLKCGNWKNVQLILENLSPELVPNIRTLVRSQDYLNNLENELRSICEQLNIKLNGFYTH